MNKPLIRIAEVAELLNITQSRAYDLAREGIIPAVRIGRQLRFDSDRVQAWIESGGQALPGGWKRESSA